MTDHRLKRPPVDRDHPIRAWSLFQTPENGKTQSTAHQARAESGAETSPLNGSSSAEAGSMPAPLSDMVERGYRVINEYLRQGQSMAEGFSPRVSNGQERNGSPQDVQQLAQRVMQYGWDFAGLWFEMWTRMAASSGATPPPPSAGGSYPNPPEAPPTTRSGADGPKPENASRSLRMTVSVECRHRTTTAIDLRPGPASRLVIHPLRAEGTDAPAIRDVVIESSPADDAVSVKVVIGDEQPPGVYNGLVIDPSSNLPRGTLSLTIHPEKPR